MITEESAKRLARDLMQPFIDSGAATENTVDLVTKIIVRHMEQDDLLKKITEASK